VVTAGERRAAPPQSTQSVPSREANLWPALTPRDRTPPTPAGHSLGGPPTPEAALRPNRETGYPVIVLRRGHSGSTVVT